ncbi:MAG: LPS-assembly protein LptD [Alphaproteobacteria bacterium]|nr:LPS-assembly protein LptD [Alphaproteobacteria bacterium]
MKHKVIFGWLLCCAVFSSIPANASPGSDNAPVDLQADSLTHDETGQEITASGHVILTQSGRKIEADKIIYYLKEDRAIATGHVIYTDPTGDKHYAERAEFSNAMKKGIVDGLQSFLTDGSRFTAKHGEDRGDVETVMKDASYTPCETCAKNPDDEPLWQIKASEVKHDKVNKRVTYKNARFELEGVPVLYTPYFAHPDGSVKRKSGFLTPSGGYKSDQGLYIQDSYYWDIAPDKDLTLGMRVMTNNAPLGRAQWRQRWAHAQLKLDGGLTYSDRTDSIGGVNVYQGDSLRSHLFADGNWDMNDKWRSGINLAMTSDAQYLRQYGIDSRKVLKNEIYTERFSGRDYAVGRFVAYQDLRVEEEQVDQPNVLPEIYANFIGEPDSVPLIGGRWNVETSFLGLRREASGQDMDRAGLGLGWNRRLTSDYGLVTVLDANMRGEFYRTRDREGALTDPSIRSHSSQTRSFANLNAQTSYPIAKQFEQSQVVIEPIVALTVAPKIGTNDNIPNEDSQDVQIDASNIFEPNRFPGLDRVEDQSHSTYGLRTGLYSFDGSYGDVFLGQSYSFDNKNNPFAVGSGLDEQQSDVVGQIRGSYEGDYTVDYRFQLDNENLTPQRHEVDAAMHTGGFSLGTQYLFAKALEGTDITETREQITNSASYNVTDHWRVTGAARHDLGSDPGLRQARVGLDYLGQCLSWSLSARRNLTDEASGDSGTEVFFRIGLKNLGGFEERDTQ